MKPPNFSLDDLENSRVLQELKQFLDKRKEIYERKISGCDAFNSRLSELWNKMMISNPVEIRRSVHVYEYGFVDALDFVKAVVERLERNELAAKKEKYGFVDYDKLAEKEGLKEPEFIPGKERPYSYDENVDDFDSSNYDRDDYTRERDEYVDGGEED